jgi:hypothetical protein
VSRGRSAAFCFLHFLAGFIGGARAVQILRRLNFLLQALKVLPRSLTRAVQYFIMASSSRRLGIAAILALCA